MNLHVTNPDTDLSDPKVVGKLIRSFAKEMLEDESDPDEKTKSLDQKARGLARILLGQDPNYHGPPWFSPGQIDQYVADQLNFEDNDPEETVAHALINLVLKLHQFVLNREPAWQKKTDSLLNHYTSLMMGIPT